MVAWADGPKLLAHFRDLAGPLRLSDLSAYVRALGFSTDLMVSEAMQSVPMRHHDVPVGIFFIAEKECGREFTSDDEEIVTLFASQAATAIANARAHRAEQRARTDLETLIEISPVGVAVFDGAAGTLSPSTRRRADLLGVGPAGTRPGGVAAHPHLAARRRQGGRSGGLQHGAAGGQG